MKKINESYKKKKKVKVLMGGPSSEHEVSLKSGKKVIEHLNPEWYEVQPIIISKEGVWEIPIEVVVQESDVIFIAMHGKYGEDGTVQSLLDEKRIPYTGSNTLSSALAMNKFLAGEMFRRNGLAVPLTFLVGKEEWNNERDEVVSRVKHYLSFPIVVKPNNQGSSVGVHIVRSWDEWLHAMRDAFKISREVLVQAFIKGKEVTCGVLDHGWSEGAYPLLPTEIVPRKSHFFDYNAKYDIEGSEEITPARISDHQLHEVQRVAVTAHKSVGATGFSRTDMIIDEHGTIYVLEINTIPGLTEESLLPKAAMASGIPFSELLDRVIRAALKE